jgi:DNA-binding HxlR family transcriptional regulator
MPRVRHKLLTCSPGCPVEGVLHLIDGKWKGVILYHLRMARCASTKSAAG